MDGLRTCLADILVTTWGIKGSAAFDVTVISPLNSSIVSEAGVTSGVAARAAETRKHEENDAKCTELGWMCVPLAVECYSAWEVVACNAFSFLARREAIITNSPKSEVLCDLFGRLSFILIQSNARAILARSGLVLDGEVDPE